jgi:hypothetical protein
VLVSSPKSSCSPGRKPTFATIAATAIMPAIT